MDNEREKGLSYIFEKMERDKILTPDDVMEFMDDLGLPPFSVEEIGEKMTAIGVQPVGFLTLNDFFAFIQNEIQEVTPEKAIEAFQVFDRIESGFIIESKLRKIITILGDPLSAEDTDKIMRIADSEGDGSVNYEKVVNEEDDNNPIIMPELVDDAKFAKQVEIDLSTSGVN